MPKYKIAIEETIVDNFEVEANSLKEAIETAIQNYKKGEFVLEPGNLVSKQLAVIEPSYDEPEWIKF